MRPSPRGAALLAVLVSITVAQAQTEVSHLFIRNYTEMSPGAFLQAGVPVTWCGMIVAEPSAELFSQGSHYLFTFPLLAGYRQSLGRRHHTGFFVEPLAGYVLGSASLPRTDASGKVLLTPAGDTLQQRVTGPAAGVAIGYTLPRSGHFTMQLLYEHTFESGHPQIDLLSLRTAYTFVFGRRWRGE